MEKNDVSNKVILISGTIITWFAVVLQFYLIIVNRQASIPETIIRYFSFYTILTNILVAVCFTVLLLGRGSSAYKFFYKKGTLTAITVYIAIVGIVYNVILRYLWDPQGLQRLVDELLHVAVPVLFIFYWFLFSPKESLNWKSVFSWLVYPFVYLIFILIRGAIAFYYPYPFVDVNALGYEQVFLNCIGLFFAFLLLSLIMVAVTKIKKRA